MTAPKAKTLQARFGFSDPELTTPKHDAIMLWLDANIDQVLTDALGVEYVEGIRDDTKSLEQIQSLSNRVAEISKRIEEIKSLDVEKEHNRRFEEHVKSLGERYKGGAGTVGEKLLREIWDSALEKDKQDFEAEKQKLEKEFDSKTESIRTAEAMINAVVPVPSKSDWVVKCRSKTWEKPIVSDNGRTSYTIGFVDMAVSFSEPKYMRRYNPQLSSVEYKVGHEERVDGTAYFEVKPSIPSLGEVIRQVRMYQTYTVNAPWFIVSPDDRFSEQLRDQGIGFVKVPNTI